jgi:hypothetical protein
VPAEACLLLLLPEPATYREHVCSEIVTPENRLIDLLTAQVRLCTKIMKQNYRE